MKPVIHVSKPEPDDSVPTRDAKPMRKTLSPRPSLRNLRDEPRRFHLSKAMMDAQRTLAPAAGVHKRSRRGPAVFVERSRKRASSRQAAQVPVEAREPAAPQEPERKLKKPRTARAKSPRPDAPARAPLPESANKPHAEKMDKIAADLNQWVLREIGANLDEMGAEKKREERAKLRPKAPAQRFRERHPDQASEAEVDQQMDTAMTDVSDDDEGDGSDWVIDEYVRVPVDSMPTSALPGDVGVLVLEGEEDDILFFGPEYDDEDELQDEEDENGTTSCPRPHNVAETNHVQPTAENHYTADYPEDEVNSDDEYGRHPYYYRTGNASDDEEFDEDLYSDHSDELVASGDDDDVAMARIKKYMQRKAER